MLHRDLSTRPQIALLPSDLLKMTDIETGRYDTTELMPDICPVIRLQNVGEVSPLWGLRHF